MRSDPVATAPSPRPSTDRTRPLALILAALAMLGPFSIDAYLPAFPDIGVALDASQIEVQQSMTAYLIAYAAMMLWHGAISDAAGRRPVILANLGVYAFASLGCMIAGNIHTLVLFRIVQGASAGAGLAVGRAIIRDRYHGPAAQRLMSEITLLFGIAPAIAPVLGGLLLKFFGWRSIFAFLLLFTGALIAWCWRHLPETHPRELRQPLQLQPLAVSYRRVLLRADFLLLAFVVSLNFVGLFLYIASAPVFLIQHLHVSSQGFAWLFLPSISGIMLGAYVSGRVAGRLSASKTIASGYLLMYVAALANVALCYALPPSLPWNVLPLFVYTFGMSLVMPSVTLMVLDLFPVMRGLVSSLQGFVQIFLSSIVAGVISPLLSTNIRHLALGMATSVLLGSLCWFIYSRRQPLAPI